MGFRTCLSRCHVPVAVRRVRRAVCDRGRAVIRTVVVNRRTNDYDVYIGRPGPWGNPFEMHRERDRTAVIAAYAQWLRTRPDLIEAVRRELAGKRLGCWCAPRACHGDVLARVADGGAP